ncbi:hypothetical protein CQA63_07415 [Helicobacter marmotae]|uniref:Uncharacterized protein n=1 Tax=Helicobacter marmotae TaxID=152490 RepID=A0A3D8I2Q7_9HELI|nr:hypothetical protein CQA63_07415 [Helicobacter marmotae]
MRSEESLKESLVAKRDSSPLAGVQNDNESNPQDKITSQGKLVCHSEGGQSPTEESLWATSDSFCEFFGHKARKT